MKTIRELVESGIIIVESGEYKNAVVECYLHGGIKGIWIDGYYYKNNYSASTDWFEVNNIPSDEA